jgi:hypothetical protein
MSSLRLSAVSCRALHERERSRVPLYYRIEGLNTNNSSLFIYERERSRVSLYYRIEGLNTSNSSYSSSS